MALNGLIEYGQNITVYYVEHNTPFPKEAYISENWGNRQCHEKSCHCVSDYWTFGKYVKKGDIKDETEIELGRQYRRFIRDFIWTGQVPNGMEPYTGNNEWNVHDKKLSKIMKRRSEYCDLLDNIDMYMEI